MIQANTVPSTHPDLKPLVSRNIPALRRLPSPRKIQNIGAIIQLIGGKRVKTDLIVHRKRLWLAGQQESRSVQARGPSKRSVRVCYTGPACARGCGNARVRRSTWPVPLSPPGRDPRGPRRRRRSPVNPALRQRTPPLPGPSAAPCPPLAIDAADSRPGRDASRRRRPTASRLIPPPGHRVRTVSGGSRSASSASPSPSGSSTSGSSVRLRSSASRWATRRATTRGGWRSPPATGSAARPSTRRRCTRTSSGSCTPSSVRTCSRCG